MKILLVPDKFKGSLDAANVCLAIEKALRESVGHLEINSIPMADGGEGTSNMLTHFSNGRIIKLPVLDPFFRIIEGFYGVSGDGRTAFIEMAVASGLQLLMPEERNALLGTTYGTGEMIVDALDKGVDSIILGVGGSGTNDGGIGMGEALGARFLDSAGNALKPIGQNLFSIRSIDTSHLHPRAKEVSVTAICDVSNPFYGINGAAHIFGPQKGATPTDIRFLDAGLRNFAQVAQDQMGIDLNFPGAGAGGGLGGGAKIFFNIGFCSGIEFIINFIGLEDLVRNSELVITGEGKMDEQTLSGKVVKGVADLSRKYGRPLIVIVGKNELSEAVTASLGIRKVISLMDSETTENESFERAFALIEKRVKEQLVPFFL
jgi:glycerate 2-kinase